MGSLYISNSLVTHKIGYLVQTNIVLQILHGCLNPLIGFALQGKRHWDATN
jgi:hypothetical protein